MIEGTRILIAVEIHLTTKAEDSLYTFASNFSRAEIVSVETIELEDEEVEDA